MERDTGGKMGITLSTSNDDGSMRLIVTAEETDDVVEVPSIDNDNNNRACAGRQRFCFCRQCASAR